MRRARGAGKSTWLRTTFPQAHRIDLLDESLYQAYLADVGAFAGELRALAPGSLVLLDEVQRLPALLNEVHRQIEERSLRFEGWIACLLRAYRDYRRLFEDWGYWTPGKGSSVEVDFVLQRGRDLVALEVRAGQKVFEADLRGLRAIADLPRVRRRLVVYRGERRQKTADGIDILPVAAFLAELQGASLFP